MPIQRISVGHLPPLEHVCLPCDMQVNLFIGPNASGKSTILRSLQTWHSENAGSQSGQFQVTLSETWTGSPSRPKPPMLYVPTTRLPLQRQPVHNRDQSVERALKNLFDTESEIFDGQLIKTLIDTHSHRPRADRPRRSPNEGKIVKALGLGFSCVKAICPEVISGEAPHDYIEKNNDEKSMFSSVSHSQMGISTTDISAERLYAGILSLGTQGTLLWIWALALKIAHHYDWQEGWEQKPAILLMDEIENHLHPTWQRRVIPALLDHFPNLQIFATTHSPFVVAGLKAGQVHLLSRDENGVVTATTNTEDVIGWTADEILRTMMGVDDPTDDATAAAASELRQLRNEGPRDTVEAEEQRQRRMLDLRQRVDRDLLAGGPWKAQRDAFKKRFAEELEKYRQSQDLNQENG